MKSLLLALGLGLLGGGPSHACLHPPRDYPGKMGSTIQEYLLFREGDLVHLIANQRIASNQALPEEIAWVIPLPSVPLEYRTENDTLFKWLFNKTEPVARWGVQKGGRAILSLGIVVHELVQVGKYEIQPVEIIDTSSGKEINEWLFQNGYNRVPAAGLKYYLHPGACFLAIKVKGLKQKEEVLKPLHVVYRSAEMRLPLKFFANAGVFDVYLYTPEKKGAEPLSVNLKSLGFRMNGLFRADSTWVQKTGVKGLPTKDFNLLRYLAKNVNSKENQIDAWKEDPVILSD